MTYKFASGFNNEAGLVDINPQPASPGIKAGRVSEPLDNSAFEDGYANTELVFSSIEADTYGSLLTAFSLTTSRSTDCTISLPTNADRDTFANYNATIKRIEDPDYKAFWSDVRFKVIIREAL